MKWLGILLMVPMLAFATEVGKLAPDFSLPGLKQDSVKLADYKGKVVYVDFWASWCGPCRKSFPWLNEMQQKYGKQGFTVIGINVDQKREDADKFLAQVPAQFTIAFDAQGNTPKAYQIKGMPSSLIIDQNGNVQSMHAGYTEEKAAELEATIRKALEKNPKS